MNTNSQISLPAKQKKIIFKKKPSQITINNSYQQLQKYYDEQLNTNPNLVETSNDEPTPIDCVQEMVEKIPEEFWKRTDI